MSLSITESKVIDFCRNQYVTSIVSIKSKLSISRITALRALKKHGYFSSYNFNSRYFTLKEIPYFDMDGLWSYGQIHFSRFGTLKNTIISLIENSNQGFTIMELEKRLGTHIHNHLSILCKENRLGHFYAGRNVVYVSAGPMHQEEQIKLRKAQMGKTYFAKQAKDNGEDLPKGSDVLTIIRVLVQMIQTPHESVESLVKRLQSQGISITVKEVKHVMNFYSLEKKTAH